MSHETLLRKLCAQVSADRLRDLTLDLVRIPSPTGDSVAVSEFYADTVRGIGLPVEMVLDFPQSPSTIARLNGNPEGKTLTLDGHLDTIHADHVAPYVEDGRVYGRGSGDMKSGVAAMVEATRILIENDVKLGGNLILATHSLHEAPVGHMEGLKALLARGDVFVDAAIVAESAWDTVNIRGKGQALFEITLTREGEVMHENVARPRDVPNPLDDAVRIIHAMQQRHQELAQFDEPLLGPETYFIGQIHGGDFYNRVPTQAFLNGTHRYWPGKTWEDVYAEFDDVIASIELPLRTQLQMDVFGNGLGYAIDKDEPIVRALREGYQTIVGRELPVSGALSVCDVNVIAGEGGVPAVPHGTGTTTAHADLEWVEIANIVRTTEVFLASILNYLGTS